MLRSLVIVSLLAAPALADTKTLGFTLTHGSASRHFGMKLVDDSCGKLESKAAEANDTIDVCLKSQGKTDMRLEIDWTTRHHDGEVHNKSTVIAARGQTFELDGGAVKLAISVQ